MSDSLKTAVDAWKTESTRFWTVFSFMSAINGALFVGVYLSKTPDQSSTLLLALFGIALCFTWFGIQKRLAYWVGARCKRAEEIEKWEADRSAGREQDAECPSLFTNLPQRSEVRMRAVDPDYPGLSARFGGCLMPFVFICAWIGVASQTSSLSATALYTHLTEVLILMLGFGGLACVYFGYQVRRTAIERDAAHNKRFGPGAGFTVLGIGAWTFIIFYWLWPALTSMSHGNPV